MSSYTVEEIEQKIKDNERLNEVVVGVEPQKSDYFDPLDNLANIADVDKRKAYYEYLQVDKLNTYIYILKIIYIIAAIIFFGKIIILNENYSSPFIWIFFILIIIYPLAINHSRKFYNHVISVISDAIPKNVYSTI